MKSTRSILFNGEDITGKSITERANMGISFAFQQPVRFKGVQVLDLINFSSFQYYYPYCQNAVG